MHELDLEQLRSQEYAGRKFWVWVEGRRHAAYFIEATPRTVIKLDGEHTYLWYRDKRLSSSGVLFGD